MFNNQYYANPAFGQQQGYAQVQTPKMSQGLTPQEINELEKGANNGFSLQVPPDQLLRTKCTHKKNGFHTLIDNPDGTQTCSICGETFNLVSYSTAEVQDMASGMNDILQSIKTYYLDMPESVSKEFMPIIALMKKIPQLYEIAVANFNKYDTGLHTNMNQPYGFGMYNNIMNPGMMFPGAMPVYGAGMQPGMMPQNPGMMYGYPNQGQSVAGMPGQVVNGFGYYGAPMPGQQPMGQGCQQPTNQGGPVGTTTTEATKVFNV